MKYQIITLFLVFFLVEKLNAQEIIWLSNTPPAEIVEEVKSSGMHRLSSIQVKESKNKADRKQSKYKKDTTTKKQDRGKDGGRSYGGGASIVHWIRQGSSIKESQYVYLADGVDYDLVLMSPSGEKANIQIGKNKGCYVKFGLKDEGYYNAYLIVKKPLGDTLHVNIAKAELLNHSCRNGHSKKLESRPVRFYPEITDFEVIRQREPHADFHYFASSGDEVKYKAIFEGEPVEGVKITMNTEKGWSKNLVTNSKGELSYQFIQDYFTHWQELNNRKIYYYMLNAEYTLEKETKYKGVNYKYIHYTLTMSDGYRPARTMYASMVWGLIVFLITLIISAVGVFIYKERRKRPYKELVFDEHNK